VERGTNKNNNGLTSEYLQKGTEVLGDIDYLWAVADSLIQETKRSAHGANACELRFSAWPDSEPH